MDNVCIVGFQFSDGLLAPGYLPFGDGLTVLYGLNGAGKSRLLTGIRNALLGQASKLGVNLVVRLPSSAGAQRADYRAPGASRDVLTAVAEAIAGPNDIDDFATGPFGETIRDSVTPKQAELLVERHLARFSCRGEYEDVVGAAQRGRLFALCPTGDSLPAWDAWLIADPGQAPIAAALEQYRQAEEGEDGNSAVAWRMFQEFPIRTSGDAAAISTRRDQRLHDLDPFGVVTESWHAADPVEALRVRGPIDFGFDVHTYEDDLDEATRALLSEHLRLKRIAKHSRDDDTFSRSIPSTKQRIQSLVSEVNDRLRSTLLDPPQAHLVVAKRGNRFSEPSARWMFTRQGQPSSAPSLPIESLSRAEEQWARFAVADSLYWNAREFFGQYSRLRGITRDNEAHLESRQVVSFFDEPEAGMHRSAEDLVVRSMVERARDPRQIIIAATHSPELLNAQGARLVEVCRGATELGQSVVQELDFSDLTTLANLGLLPSDLLRLDRVFLLVEGRHDEVLLDAFIGDQLRAARVRVLPLRGIANDKLRSVVESRVIFESTSAHLVTLVDNLPSELVSATWERATQARLLESVEAAKSIVIRELKEKLGGESTEARWVAEWLTAALDHGYESRVTPEGLSAKDIVEYLPPASLVPGAASWDALREEYAKAKVLYGSRKVGEFKPWLSRSYGADFSDSALRAAAANCAIPAEFSRLSAVLRAISSQ